MPMPNIPPDRVRGALLGAAVGDALGMPIEDLSHQNVRTYYKGIKEYRDDKHRKDLGAGQWTARTQYLFAFTRALRTGEPLASVLGGVALRRVNTEDFPRVPLATSMPACAATALGVRLAASGAEWTDADLLWLADQMEAIDPEVEGYAAAAGQVWAVCYALTAGLDGFDATDFWSGLLQHVNAAEKKLGGGHALSNRIRTLSAHLDSWPLDLQDLCDGTGRAANESWPFACAMVARAPELLDGTLLPAVNVGGDAPSIGSIAGALLGALHGWSAFPDGWRANLEDVDLLAAEADRFYASLSA
jgi:ADP-ribosylglycohydrolase